MILLPTFYSEKFGLEISFIGIVLFIARLIDIITEHTHPTGTGPSGPPMPPATAKLSLLKSLKVSGSFE